MAISMEICKAQIAVEQAYVAYFQARIQSGSYKTRVVMKGGYGDDKERMTKDELLDDELATMLRHIHRMNEIIDVMPEPMTEQVLDESKEESLKCDKCGAATPDPWHSSEGLNRHVHTCDRCHVKQRSCDE